MNKAQREGVHPSLMLSSTDCTARIRLDNGQSDMLVQNEASAGDVDKLGRAMKAVYQRWLDMDDAALDRVIAELLGVTDG